MDQLISQLDIPGLVTSFGPTSSPEKKDKARGNFQRTFGVACGQNVGPPVTADSTLEFSGCTHPRLNKDSKEPAILKAFDIAWQVGRVMGIDYCQKGFVEENPWAKPTFDFVERMLGQAGFAAMSLCLLELDSEHRITRHTDDANDPRLSGVLNISELIYFDDKWQRASILFFMRKSIPDMNIRREACNELFTKCVGYISKCEEKKEKYRLPSPANLPPEEEVKLYFEKCVGRDGAIVTIDTKTSTIVNAALRTKASANKQGNFLAPVACALIGLLKCHKMCFESEFVELLSIVGYLSNIYEFVTVLNMMQDDWDRNDSLASHGGLVGYVFRRMVQLVGSVAGGAGRRCQTFLNKDFVMKDVRSNCHEFRRTIRQLLRDRESKLDLEQPKKNCRQSAEKIISGLAGRCKSMGPMTVSHAIHALGLVNIAPSYLLEYATFSPSATQFQTKNMSRTLRAYLGPNAKKDKEVGPKSDRFATLLTSLTRALQAKTNNPNISEAMAENLLCEASRSTVAYDLFLPGQCLYRKPPTNDNTRGQEPWLAIFPIVDNQGFLSYITEEQTDITKLFENDSGWRNKANVSQAIWGTENESVPDYPISIGKKRKKDDCVDYPYFELVITHDELGTCPGLLHDIKLAISRQGPGTERHKDFMDRLNGIPELTKIIRKHLDLRSDKIRKAQMKKRKVTFDVMEQNESEAELVEAEFPNQLGPPAESTCPVVRSVPHDSSTWQRSGLREIPELSVTYRVFQTSEQCLGTVLEGGCFGYTGPASFQGVVTVVPFANRVPPTNTFHSVLSSAAASGKEVPRLICCNSRTRRRGKRNNRVGNYRFETHSNNMFRVSCDFIPDTAMGADPSQKSSSCKLQDMIAMSLGGVRHMKTNPDKSLLFWYFPSQELAIDYFTLWAICVFGDVDYYKKLMAGVLKQHSSIAVSAQDKAAVKVSVVGYTMEAHTNGPGVVGYYLLAMKEKEPDHDRPNLVIAIPSREHSRLRADGPVNKRTLGKGDNVCFFRLL